MSEFVDNFEEYIKEKGAIIPETQAKSFSGNGVSFSLVDGKPVASYESDTLTAKAKYLSQKHQKIKNDFEKQTAVLGR